MQIDPTYLSDTHVVFIALSASVAVVVAAEAKVAAARINGRMGFK